MSPNPTPTRAALAAVRRLEDALEERHDATDLAEAALDAARAEAEYLLSEAHAEGTRAGLRRRADLLADAEADAMAIRATGEADAAKILWQQSAERADLIAEFMAVVLGQEA
jgi:hypothetical protein